MSEFYNNTIQYKGKQWKKDMDFNAILEKQNHKIFLWHNNGSAIVHCSLLLTKCSMISELICVCGMIPLVGISEIMVFVLFCFVNSSRFKKHVYLTINRVELNVLHMEHRFRWMLYIEQRTYQLSNTSPFQFITLSFLNVLHHSIHNFYSACNSEEFITFTSSHIDSLPFRSSLVPFISQFIKKTSKRIDENTNFNF